MVAMICMCGNHYSAKQADLNRGWGLSCSKKCAAIRREFEGKSTKRAKKSVKNDKKELLRQLEEMDEQACDDDESGWDGHKIYF